MSKIIKNGYKGRDTEILCLDYFDEEDGTVFIVRILDFDVIIGKRDNSGWRDIEHAKQAFDYFNSFLPIEDRE